MKRAPFRLWVVGLGLCVLAFSAVAGGGILSGGPERGLGPPPEPSPGGAGDGGKSVATPLLNQSPWFRVYDRPLRVVASDSGLSLASVDHEEYWVFLTPTAGGLEIKPASYEERVFSAGRSEWHLGFFRCGRKVHVWDSSRRRGYNRAVLSPQGDRLALGDEHREGIWVADVQGASSPLRLTSPADWSVFQPFDPGEGWEALWAVLPAWSPDGRTVYFLTNRREGRNEIWQVDVAAGGERPLYGSEGELANFVGVAANGNLLLWVPRKLLLLDPSGQTLESYPLGPGTTSWSPDHARVAVLDGEANRLYFHTGSALTEVTGLPEGYTLNPLSGAWSSDGAWFALYATRYASQTSPREDRLLLLPAEPGGPAPAVSLTAPEGYSFDSMSPLSWVGNSLILAVVYPAGHWSDGPMETWAYSLRTP